MSAVKAETSSQPELHSLLEVMPSKECHCHRCGARIAEGDARCAACGKKQQVKNTSLLDFLIAHTKDDITGKLTDSLYEAIKNFLRSHLFGLVVSLSLVAAAGVTVYASEPYIERVRPPLFSVTTEVHTSADLPADDEPYPYQQEHEEASALLSAYLTHVTSPPDSGTYEADGQISDTTVGELLAALCLPESYGYGGTFALQYDEAMTIESSGGWGRTVFDPDQLETDLARRLAADGHLAGENIAHVEYGTSHLEGDEIVFTETLRIQVRFVFVRMDGAWYIAGNEILERTVL